MYFEAKIGLFFRRTLAVIGSIAAKRLTITGSSKLAYCSKGKLSITRYRLYGIAKAENIFDGSILLLEEEIAGFC